MRRRKSPESEATARKGVEFAQWRDLSGKLQAAALTRAKSGEPRIKVLASKWTAEYRDGEGVVREVATGCRDKQAAMAVLDELKTQADKVAELTRLLDAARQRPLTEAMTVRTGPNEGLPVAKVAEHRVPKLQRLGRERALIYKTLVLTGLRANELRTLECRDLSFGDVPFVSLRHSNEKSRKGSTVPLRSDLAADLREWIKGREPGDKVFVVPAGILRILDRDLKAAGIDTLVAPKTGSQGKSGSIADHSAEAKAADPETTKPRKTLGFTGFSGSRDDKIRTCDLCTPRGAFRPSENAVFARKNPSRVAFSAYRRATPIATIGVHCGIGLIESTTIEGFRGSRLVIG
ncbi:site-specific integrase [Stieleria sp. ICT_E10.1]|uniref:site-specific integrase n=1 Tax=Stieleria sedimenti TaxID=2976331 RepID=UPI00217F8003|nr:site-specific integrase [Stieleria sedimenti]MCS7466151.1 site-specific integrase [Stieleria sedimenti]